MKIGLILSLFFTFSFVSFAQNYNMHRCALLPVTDGLNGSISFSVYQSVENYLKTSSWCDYESNAKLMDIFSRYNKSLDEHLRDKDILKVVSDKLKVGSLIRIELVKGARDLKLNLEVVGDNGEDLYFKKEEVVSETKEDTYFEILKSWLDEYSFYIPYDGRVLGVLGDNISLELSKNKSPEIRQEFFIKRLLRKKKHKLLKTVVSWETDTIGSGYIDKVSKGQALGTLKVHSKKLKILPKDWVSLGEKEDKVKEDDSFLKPDKNYSFGILGNWEFFLNLGFGGFTSDMKTNNKSAKGVVYGLGVASEVYITRNYFVYGEFVKKLGNFSKTKKMDKDSIDTNSSRMKITGGYKYLPLSFFYGPQINFYTGYTRYNYSYSKSKKDGVGEYTLSGIILGTSVDVPLYKNYRVQAKGEFLPFPKFQDEDNIYKSFKSANSLLFEVGGTYLYSKDFSLKASLELLNNKVKLKKDPSEITSSDTSLKVGAIFTF